MKAMRGQVGDATGKYPSSEGNGEVNVREGGIIKHNRKCRDLVFLVIFIAFWVSMIVNSSFGFNQGNPLRLSYGLDYKGNICGDKHADPNLHELDLKYWLNPNEVYQTSSKDSDAKLANARSICLLDCPTPSDDSLNWVCDYPEGDLRLSVDDWVDRNYDYFADLTPELRNTSLQLLGPCYPVIFPSINAANILPVHRTCYDHKRSCCFVPCGHFATCLHCAKRISEGEAKICPFCRTDIHMIRRLFSL